VTTDPDDDLVSLSDVQDVLAELVLHLMERRDRGASGARTLKEQAHRRAGYTEAIRAVASSRLLLSLLRPVDAERLTGR
jgi:hypothetical protein